MNFIKKLLGIDKIEEKINTANEALLRAEQELEQAKISAENAKEEARIAALTPKERANEKREPYVAVVETHVNEKNVKSGYFELDWNEFFVLQLKVDGYPGETDDEIVNSWFTTLCQEIGKSAGWPVTNKGYINVQDLGNGIKEVS